MKMYAELTRIQVLEVKIKSLTITKLNRKYRFISNWKSFRLQGDHMLPKTGDYLVITKSLKDVMTLYNLGIPAIAPISENCFLSEAQYHRLKERFKHIILLYDNDRPGLRAMISIKKKFPEIIPI